MFEASAFHPLDPEAGTLSRIRTQITGALTPVRPLPPDRVLVPVLALLLIALAVAVSFAVGNDGFFALTLWQRYVYYAAIALAIVEVSRAAVSESIPGSRRALRPVAALLLYLTLIAGVVLMLFHSYDLTGFAHYGVHCLTIGTVSGLAAALLLWKPIRGGFFTSPVRAGAIIGALCGLVGIAVLAIFCPLQNPAHILVWHFGVVLLATLGGMGLAALSH